jgi:hypothetical protein
MQQVSDFKNLSPFLDRMGGAWVMTSFNEEAVGAKNHQWIGPDLIITSTFNPQFDL